MPAGRVPGPKRRSAIWKLSCARWTGIPPQTATFAGALQYSKYGIFKKPVMRLIARMVGNDTDTTRDYEYTDWDAVERFADAFAQQLEQT